MPETDTTTSKSATPTQTPAPTSTPDLRGDRLPMERADEISEPPDGQVTEVSVGSRPTRTERGHLATPTIEVWNLGPDREISVLVRGARTGTHLDQTTRFARDEALVLSFDGEDRYLVAVGVAGESEYATVIDRGRFFCNDSTTFAYIQPDGVVESVTSTTELECPTETADG